MPGNLNYKHLYYFWTVARHGSIAAASELLHITPQTISGQLSMLEDMLGDKLFQRQGRGLVLTEKGHVVLRYADDIFNLGQELQEVLRGTTTQGQIEFKVGVLDGIPKTIAYLLLKPALDCGQEVRITCSEGSMEKILADLAVHKLDMILTDTPLPATFHIKAYNHFLGESGISFFASPKLAVDAEDFPGNLDGNPLLLPTSNSTIRRIIDQWLDEQQIYPKLIGEFDDSALLKAFGQAAVGAFSMPTVIETDVCEQFGVDIIGRTDTVKQQFYAISAERKIKHPAIAAIYDAAKLTVFL